MDFKKYQEEASKTAIYPENAKITYPLLGLNGEVGEVCEKVKKHIRDGRELDKEDLTKELGDVLWYLSATARDLGIDLQEVAEKNIEKLKSRQQRGTLQGSGDNPLITMPIRKTDPDLQYVTREYGQGKTITRTVAEWRESDERIAKITEWNNEITELCKILQTELREEHETETISIIPDRYKKLQENQGGFDKFVPRNYLSYEVVRVENGTEKMNYYFGRFSSTEDLVETLKQDIYVKRKADKNSGSSSNDTDGDGGGFRERRFPRDTDESCESNDDLQD